MRSIHADWMNLLYFQCLLSSQIGETTPQHQQLPQSSGKTEKHTQSQWPEHLTKISSICLCKTNQPFLYCKRLRQRHRWAKRPKHKPWVNDLLCHLDDFWFTLTMPTHVLVSQGLESSFLYTSSFPLVSPTTSSFSYHTDKQFNPNYRPEHNKFRF